MSRACITSRYRCTSSLVAGASLGFCWATTDAHAKKPIANKLKIRFIKVPPVPRPKDTVYSSQKGPTFAVLRRPGYCFALALPGLNPLHLQPGKLHDCGS